MGPEPIVIKCYKWSYGAPVNGRKNHGFHWCYFTSITIYNSITLDFQIPLQVRCLRYVLGGFQISNLSFGGIRMSRLTLEPNFQGDETQHLTAFEARLGSFGRWVSILSKAELGNFWVLTGRASCELCGAFGFQLQLVPGTVTKFLAIVYYLEDHPRYRKWLVTSIYKPWKGR